MKNYKIHCIILDKYDPLDLASDTETIELYTTVEADSENIAIEILNNTYNVQAIKSIEEII